VLVFDPTKLAGAASAKHALEGLQGTRAGADAPRGGQLSGAWAGSKRHHHRNDQGSRRALLRRAQRLIEELEHLR
jgi:hypothetical protein